MNPTERVNEPVVSPSLLASEPIDVVDNLRDIVLGQLQTIDCQQLQLLGDVALEAGKSYKLDLHLPFAAAECPSIHLGADCSWRRAAADGRVLTGLIISDISPQAREQIQQLMDRLAAQAD